MLQAASSLRQARAHDVHRRRRDAREPRAWRTRAHGTPRCRMSRLASTDYAESRITAGPQYLRVDFGSCDRLELSETYRSFAHLCLGTQVNRALLQAGDDEPEGHRQLHEAL